MLAEFLCWISLSEAHQIGATWGGVPTLNKQSGPAESGLWELGTQYGTTESAMEALRPIVIPFQGPIGPIQGELAVCSYKH